MKYAFGVILLGLCVGCARQPWPEPPVIDQATYQKDYQKWLDAQQETARDGTKEVGIWPLQEGETAFGSDASLPIALPVRAVPESSRCLSSSWRDGHRHSRAWRCASRRRRGSRQDLHGG